MPYVLNKVTIAATAQKTVPIYRCRKADSLIRHTPSFGFLPMCFVKRNKEDLLGKFTEAVEMDSEEHAKEDSESPPKHMGEKE